MNFVSKEEVHLSLEPSIDDCYPEGTQFEQSISADGAGHWRHETRCLVERYAVDSTVEHLSTQAHSDERGYASNNTTSMLTRVPVHANRGGNLLIEGRTHTLALVRTKMLQTMTVNPLTP